MSNDYSIWNQYPWGNATGTQAEVMSWASTGNTTYTVQPWYYPTVPVASEFREAEKIPLPESAMEWLKRRVEEITDLAYTEV